jgi:hypothetical protein
MLGSPTTQRVIFEIIMEKARRNKIEASEKADTQLAAVIATREKMEAMIAVEQNNAGEKSLYTSGFILKKETYEYASNMLVSFFFSCKVRRFSLIQPQQSDSWSIKLLEGLT